VTEEIWVCADETVTKYEGDIFKYKDRLVKIVRQENERLAKLNK